MYPRLFDIGPFAIYTYGLLLALSYLLGLRMGVVRGAQRGIDRDKLMDLGIWVIFAAFVGAKLLLVVVDLPYYVSHPGDLFRAAGVFYGGFIAASAVAIVYMRRHRLPLWTTADAIAPGIALGHVVGRLGCFLGGCCYGRETTVPWAVIFTNPESNARLNVPLHPTQLYESGAELAILIGLLAFEKRGRAFPGRTFFVYLIAYSVSRFIIEFYRGDPRGFVFGTISTSQFISLLLIPVSVFMLMRLSREWMPSARRAAPAPVTHPSGRARTS